MLWRVICLASLASSLPLSGCAGFLSPLGKGAVAAYRTVIRPTYPARCPFSPSCSDFAGQAIDKLGAAAGILASTDRFVRCHPLSRGLYPTLPGGRLADPVGADPPPPPCVPPSIALSPDEERQIAFALSLEESGDAHRAATEWMRFLECFPESARADFARTRLGLSLYAAGDPERAAATFRTVSEGPWRLRSELYLSQMEDKLLPGSGAARRQRLLAQCDGEDDRTAVRFVDALWSAVRGDTAAAALRFVEISQSVSDSTAAVYALGRARAARDLVAPSATAAMALAAVLPGSGHAYAGRWQDGLFTFIVNSAFITGAVFAAQNEEEVTAGFLAAGAALFYSGNLYGAARAADQAGEQLRLDFFGDAFYTAEEKGWFSACLVIPY